MHESVKPDDIPQEVWDKASAVTGFIADQVTAAIMGTGPAVESEASLITPAIARLLMADRARSPQDAKPVAWRYRGPRGGWITVETEPPAQYDDVQPLYATPPLAIEALREALKQIAESEFTSDEWVREVARKALSNGPESMANVQTESRLVNANATPAPLAVKSLSLKPEDGR
jgi:hypothetical protein